MPGGLPAGHPHRTMPTATPALRDFCAEADELIDAMVDGIDRLEADAHRPEARPPPTCAAPAGRARPARASARPAARPPRRACTLCSGTPTRSRGWRG